MEVEHYSLEMIDGVECRMIIIKGEPFACIADVYHQLGIDPRTARGIISRNESQFTDYIVKINGSDLQSVEVNPSFNFELGFQKGTMYNFLNETGYNLFIQKIDPELIGSEEMKEMIFKRQRGMAEVFTKYRRKEIISTQSVTPAIHPSMRSPEQVAKDKIDLGVYIADIFNLPKQMMVSMGLAEAAKETGVSFEHYQKCLPAASGSYACAHISARDIGKPYGDDGRRVNRLLAKLGYIYRVGKSWELTDEGKEMGGDYFHFTNEKNEHKGIYVQWPETIREIVEKHKDML